MKRFARMRSELSASQFGSGAAQWSVGSIDAEGIREGVTTHALTANTLNTATTIVTSQSTTVRAPRDMFGKSLSTGPRTSATRQPVRAHGRSARPCRDPDARDAAA